MASDKLSQKILDLHKYVEDLKRMDVSEPSKAAEILSNVIEGLQAHLDGLTGAKEELFQDLSERESNNALREWKRFRILAEAAFEGIVFTKNGRIIEANEQFARAHGYELSEVIGRPVTDFLVSEDRERARQSIESGQEHIGEYHALRKDGSIFLLEAHGHIIEWEEGPVRVSVLRDITDHKQTEKALRESRQKYKDLIETTSDFIWEVDSLGRFTYFSPQVEKSWGIKPDELIGKTPFDFMPADDKKRATGIFLSAVKSQAPFSGLYTTSYDRQGHLISIETSGVPIFDDNGKPLGFRGISRDITERKHAEEALRESQTILKTIIESTPDYISLKDREGRYIMMNSAASERLSESTGLSAAEIIGKKDDEILPLETARPVMDEDRQVVTSGKIRALDQSFTVGNNLRSFSTIKSPYRDIAGNIVGIVNVSRDITERKQAEVALRESEQKFKAITDTSQAAITLYQDGHVIYANKASEAIFGYSFDERSRMKLSDLLHPDYREKAEERMRALLKGEPCPSLNEYTIIRKDGEERWVLSSGSKITYRGKAAVMTTSVDITERKHAEEALRESEERLRFVLKTCNIGAWDMGIEDHITIRSPEHDRIYGYNVMLPEWTYEMFLDHVIPEDRSWVDATYQNAIKSQSSWSFEFRIRRPDGQIRWIWATGDHRRDPDGSVRRVAGIVQDITERKQAGEELKESERRFRDAIDHFPNVFVIYDADRRIKKINSKGLEILGLSEQDLIGRKDEEIFPSQMINSYLPTLKRAIETKTPQMLERKRHSSLGGQTIAISIIPLLNETREIRQILAISHDISEHKRMEEELRRSKDELEQRVQERTAELMKANLALAESEDRFRVALKNSPIVVFNQDRDLRYTWIYNPHPAFTADTFLGKTDEEFFPAEDTTQLTKIKRRVLESGLGERAEIRTTIKGEEIFYDLTVEPLRNASGEIEGITCAAMDITERKKAEEKLKNQALMLDSVSDAVIGLDMDQRINYWSLSAKKMYGYSAEEVLGRHSLEVLKPEYLGTTCKEVLSLLASTGQIRVESIHYAKDGRRIFAEVHSQLLYNKEGKPYGQLGINRDITERKMAESELLKAKEAAEAAAKAKAAFLANMSHEIRTPMNAVIGMTDLMLGDALTPEQRENLELIRINGDALLAIINDILDLSKIESNKLVLEEQSFELRLLVEEALDLIALKASEKGLNLEYTLDKNVPNTIISDPSRLRQILGNLLSNAVKFTDKGEVTLSVSVYGANEVHFAVQDTGIGIPQDHMNLLFQPFNQMEPSTHRLYGGTGLGLAISKNLVELMDGKIWAESEVGKGSTFHFIMKTSGQSEPQHSEVSPILIGKHMLIVSESKTNRIILSRQAYDWGMVPMSATSGLEALKYVYRGDDFDVAVLDMDLKGMSGLELEEDIRKYNKTLPLVLLTSLGQRIPPGQAYLIKPIKPSQLHKVLVDILSTVQPVRQTAQMATIGRLGQGKPLRILLAEDNVSSQKVTLGMLKRLGYKADIAANGIEVLQALERQPYDVVLMDIKMPEMDGFEASRLIRRRWPDNGPKIIAITAYAIEGDREKCLEVGMDDYIAKPVKMGELADALKRCSLRSQ